MITDKSIPDNLDHRYTWNVKDIEGVQHIVITDHVDKVRLYVNNSTGIALEVLRYLIGVRYNGATAT